MKRAVIRSVEELASEYVILTKGKLWQDLTPSEQRPIKKRMLKIFAQTDITKIAFHNAIKDARKSYALLLPPS